MSELRQRMLEDMRLAGLAETTQERYVRAVRRLAKTFMRPPSAVRPPPSVVSRSWNLNPEP